MVSEEMYDIASSHCKMLWGFIILSVCLSLVVLSYKKEVGKWFLLMTLVWCVINASINMWLLNHIKASLDFDQLKWLVKHVTQMLTINIWLDISYLVAGVILISLKSKRPNLFHGFGSAVIFQAIGLLTLDFIFLSRFS